MTHTCTRGCWWCTTAARLRKYGGTLAAFALIAAMIGLTVVSMAPPIAGPRHVCRGYVTIPPRNQMSDLYGGAITQQLPKCRLR